MSAAAPQPGLSRRRFLSLGAQLAAAGAAGALLAGCGASSSFTAPDPASASTVSVDLDVAFAQHSLGNRTFTARSYNGLIGGPAIYVRPGDVLRVRVRNHLPPNPDPVPADENVPHHFNTTNIHTHGLHVSPRDNSDNVFIAIEPGTSFEYEYHIPPRHPAGTFWYHPHNHGATAVQLFSGMSGPLIVVGDIDLVPEIFNMREVVFMVNELVINAQGQVPDFAGPASFPTSGSVFTVNGELVPTFRIRPGELQRFRVINASTRATVPFSIQDHELNLIAFDGITLPAVQAAPSVTLVAANRADFIVRGGTPGTYAITKAADSPGGGGTIPAATLAMLVVEGAPTEMAMPGRLPGPLPTITTAELTGSRVLTYAVSNVGGPGPGLPNFTIDGVRFDADTINQPVVLGAVEEWTLLNTSMMPHPHHIHINPFQLVERNGVPLATPVWMDTVDVPAMGSVKVRQRFEDFTGKFVLHCHILTHEDLGMMQVVDVS